MTEYVSRITKDKYKIIFETDDWNNYQECQEAIRMIIDKNKIRRTDNG